MVSPTTSSTGLTLESLPEINLSELSQSELHTLSLCSNSAFKLHNTNDLITPSVNPSLFNKSARQIYSRPYRRRRISPTVISSANSAPPHDPGDAEDRTIVGYLRNLLGDRQREFSGLERVVEGNLAELSNPERVVESNSGAIVVYEDEGNGRNRKRKRGSGGKSNVEVELSNVNSNGVVVDFQVLGNSDEYYSEELRKRTEGLRTEEEGLGFLRGLNGKWCSRRKKRKFVDASEFGDRFPVGWKILLSLRRRNGSATIYCRRYVSPAGEHFVSCKEASLYLQSYFRDRDNQKTDQMAANVEQVGNVASGTHAGVIDKESDMQVDSLPISSLNDEELDIWSTDNLYEVPVRAVFDCSKCELTFEQKSKYLGHMLEFHQKTTRMYTLDKFAASGLVIDDEKYKRKEKSTNEAQMGVYFNKTKGSKESPVQVTDKKSSESPLDNGLQSRASMVDAVEEIACRSVLENAKGQPIVGLQSRASMLGAVEEIAYRSVLENVKDQPIGEPRICCSSNNLNSEISETNSDRVQSLGMAAAVLAPKLKLCDGGHLITDENRKRIDGISDIGNCDVVCTRTLDHPKLVELKICCSSKEGNCGVDHDNLNKLIADTEKGVTESSVLSVQSLHCNAAADPISYKQRQESRLLSAVQITDNVSESEELRFDKTEPLHDGGSLPEVFMELPNDAGTESEELRFDKTEPLHDGGSLPEVFMELPNDAGTVEVEQETVVLNNCEDGKEVEPQIVALKQGGSVGMEDVEQQKVVSTNCGDKRIEEVNAEIFALSDGGDVGMEDVAQETVVLNNHGGARIEEVKPQIVVLYSGGNVEMEDIEEETIMFNNHGDAKIKEVVPEIFASDDGGNVGMEDVEPDFASRSSVVCLITSVCVWCAKKFTRETIESEDHSESVGFMCPTCKATISKHLDNGFHNF